MAMCLVVGMTAYGFAVADPRDAGMLESVGFGTAVPQIVADFIRG